MISNMEKEHIIFMMEKNSKEIGLITRNMEKEY